MMHYAEFKTRTMTQSSSKTPTIYIEKNGVQMSDEDLIAELCVEARVGHG